MESYRQKVLEFAKKAHAGQKRKDGKDYVTHLEAVAEYAWLLLPRYIQFEFVEYGSHEDYVDEVYAVGILHDILEDTDITYDTLELELGFVVAQAVKTLTRQKDETYYAFIHRIVSSGDSTAMFVKLADLSHNMSDLKEGSLKDKYRFAYDVIFYNAL